MAEKKTGKAKIIGYLLAGFVLISFSLIEFKLITIPGFTWTLFSSEYKYRVMVPLYCTNTGYLDFMNDNTQDFPYAKYARRVSQDTYYAIHTAKNKWFKDHPDAALKRKDIDFFFYPEGTDPITYKEAFKEAIKRSEADGYDVVASIGHITSTATREYAEFYGEKELPVIMPLATSTDLIDYLTTICNVPAVLRLIPPNNKQAEAIAKFLMSQGAETAIIVKDLGNPSYSDDLTSAFREAYIRTYISNDSSVSNVFKKKHGKVLAVIPSGGKSGVPVLYPALGKLDADALTLFSMTECGLEALIQGMTVGLCPEIIIFTDGAVDEYLIPRANALLWGQRHCIADNSGSHTLPEKLYLSFPLEQPMPKGLEKVLSEVEGIHKRNLNMTHAQYCVDAVYIMLTILDRDIVRAERKSDAREVIIEKFKEWANKKEIPSFADGGKEKGVVFDYDNKRAYKLDNKGNSTNIDYHIFEAGLPGDPSKLSDSVKAEWSRCLEAK